MKYFSQIAFRGLTLRCPQCGIGRCLARWDEVEETCSHCAYPLASRVPETWFFMYLTTGAITGLFILGIVLVRPEDENLGRWVIGIGAILSIVVTVPLRKGLALALDYYLLEKLKKKGF